MAIQELGTKGRAANAPIGSPGKIADFRDPVGADPLPAAGTIWAHEVGSTVL